MTMPIPKPKKNESEDDFIERCMSDDGMQEDYPDNDQRLAICFDSWRKAKGEKKSEDEPMEERGAIGSHKTATSDAAWDGPGNEKKLKEDQEAGYYRKAFAWQDPDGDPKTKAAYKFPHHEVDGDGNIGAANIKGCQSGIGVLNGGRGGTTIPNADRKGVWNHLAGHIRDADLEPAELKSIPPDMERRSFVAEESGEELRMIGDDGESPRIVGYAAVFNRPSEAMGFFGQKFIEKIAPGAFKNAIKNSDTRSLFNHDPNIVLGRKSAGTLKLKEDEKGLFMEVTPPDTQLVRDMVLTPIKRGDVKEQSFGFTVKTDQWDEDKGKNIVTRTLIEIDTLYDTSPVTFPAYADTSVAVRSMEQWRKETEPQRSEPDPGATPKGWEDITSADADKAERDLSKLDTRLRKIEISEL